MVREKKKKNAAEEEVADGNSWHRWNAYMCGQHPVTTLDE